MKKKNAKSHGLDREHKDITCAVRLPRSMYQALGRCAKVENTSLSDIIREALVEKMKQVEEAERERVLKEAEYEARLRELGVDPRKTAWGLLGPFLRLESLFLPVCRQVHANMRPRKRSKYGSCLVFSIESIFVSRW